MIVNTKEMLELARLEKYAVPHFNINNLEWMRFVLEECEANQSPVILGVSEGAAKYMGGFQLVANMIRNFATNNHITVPVAIHLDHGTSTKSCIEAINSGFTSVMIDASKEALEENIKITKEVVDYAHDRNITVEAEVGHIGGTEDGITMDIAYSKVEDCGILVSQTQVDSFAPAVGSVHGFYKGEPEIQFSLISEIQALTNVPLVLHGGTGLSDDIIKQAIACGICKININTELQYAWSLAVRTFLNEHPDAIDPRKIMKGGEAAMKEALRNKIILFGSAQKATHQSVKNTY